MRITRATQIAFYVWNMANRRAAEDYYEREHPPTHCLEHRRELDSRGRCPVCSAKASRDYRAKKAAA